MPLFEYECLQCGTRVEVIQRAGDSPPEACAACGGPLKKLLSAPAVHFKGSGWYVTDYARKGASTGEAKPAEGKEAGAKEAGATTGGGGEKTAPDGAAAKSAAKTSGKESPASGAKGAASDAS